MARGEHGPYGPGDRDEWRDGPAHRRRGADEARGDYDGPATEWGQGYAGGYGRSADYGREGGSGRWSGPGWGQDAGRPFGDAGRRPRGASHGPESWSARADAPQRDWHPDAHEHHNWGQGTIDGAPRHPAATGPSYAGRGPKGYRRADQRIHEEVCELLTRHPWVDASEVEVRVEGGEVTLAGTVPDRRQKRLAEDLVADCAGVADVHNQIRVAKRD